MLSIKVLGPGCSNCQKVEEHAREALNWLKPAGGSELVKVTDPLAGLVINEQVVSEGRIPRTDEIVTWLADALNE
jgi:hypothetical protein